MPYPIDLGSGGGRTRSLPFAGTLRRAAWAPPLLLITLLASASLAAAQPAGATPDTSRGRGASALGSDLSRLYAQVSPAVVGVVSFRISRVPEGFTAAGAPSVTCRRLVASGIVSGDRGCVVTTARAAQPGDSIIVHFPGGRRVSATYLGMDPALHVAVLRLTEPGSYPSLPVQRSIEGGLPDWVAVVAYGAWTGELPAEPALTLSQRSSIETVPTSFPGAPATLWQMEAPFSPGNGGGALVSLDGRWLGLITGVVAGRAGSGGIARGGSPGSAGVIVPAEVVAQAVIEIESGRRSTQGFLGLRAVPRPAVEGQVEAASGVLVAEVLPGSPAACAGIRRGDVVLRFNGVTVGGLVELTQLVRAQQPGDRISLDLTRADRSARIELHLGDRHAAGLYLTGRRQELTERCALELELKRLSQRRDLIQGRLEMLGEAVRDSAPRSPIPGRPQTSVAP